MPEDRPRMIKDWKMYREQALKLAEEGTILVYGEFCPEMEEIVLDALQVARSKGKKEATVLINSNGGKNRAYTTIKSAMALSGMKFTAIVIGAAYSNGFMLLQTCHRRLAVPGSFVMFHWGSSTLLNSELAAIFAGETWPIETMKRSEMQAAEFVANRTGVSIERLIEFALYERNFMVEEAVRVGFLDAVLPELPGEFKLPDIE